jgi:hypothetical protein
MIDGLVEEGGAKNRCRGKSVIERYLEETENSKSFRTSELNEIQRK